MSSSSLIDADAREALAQIAPVEFDFPMSRRTTLKIGGPADALVSPTSAAMLKQVVAFAIERGFPLIAIGGGSNLLVRDGGIRGIAIATRQLRNIEVVDETSLIVESGATTGKVLALATKFGLGGVEFLGGVPGTVGGGMIMNAGTYLGEFVDVTRWVESISLTTGEVTRRNNEECGFVYRGSAIPKHEIVTQVRLDLTPRPQEEIKTDVAGLRKRRKDREPTGVHNAGSIFKNPTDDYAGRLIEACGLKGTKVGAAECSPVHANWLVNTGGATCADMLQLIDIVRDKVKEQFGVTLVLEVKVIGDD